MQWTRSTHCDSSACAEVRWERSSHCDNYACVEVQVDQDVVLLRDSKDPDGPMLRFSMEQWKEFVTFISS